MSDNENKETYLKLMQIEQDNSPEQRLVRIEKELANTQRQLRDVSRVIDEDREFFKVCERVVYLERPLAALGKTLTQETT